jgi:hypothetical protein
MSKTEFFTAVKAGETARVREILAVEPALSTAKDDEGVTTLHHAT